MKAHRLQTNAAHTRKMVKRSPARLCSLRGFLSALPAIVICFSVAANASDFDEFRVKRDEVFEFTQSPQLVRRGRQFEITFTSKAFCDVTVAVEDSTGRVIRHLVSGVLGENAPPPLVSKSLAQRIVWDGKDDHGRYVDDLADLSVRVSLGLKPQFERTLFWSPYKRVSRNNRPLVAANESGVFVFEGEGADHLRMYDHSGTYLRTVYPFPADKLPEVQGLATARFPQSGRELPLKHGLVQATMLTSGRNTEHGTLSKYQAGATSMAIAGSRIALASEKLNRLATNGTSGGLTLTGPATALEINFRGAELSIEPRSAALSPDGRWLYLTGYQFKPEHPRPHTWIPCVMRLEFAANAPLELFAGSISMDEVGSDAEHFKVPTSVACDAQGRVYVADYMNDRVQVFSAEKQLLQTLKVHKPAELAIDQTCGEIYLGSWMMLNRYSAPGDVQDPLVVKLPPLDAKQPAAPVKLPLPILGHNPNVFMNKEAGLQYGLAVDSWATPATLWLIPASNGSVSELAMVRGQMDKSAELACIRLLQEREGKLEIVRDFGQQVLEDIVRAAPPVHARQKLYVNPRTGKLYIFEGQAGVTKSVRDLLEIDPATGSVRPFPLPFDAEDLAFDLAGHIYLRTDNVVGRFRPDTWQEVPFDYGEERKSVGFSSSRDGRQTDLVGALVLPAQRPGCFHQGGMHVSTRGNVVVSCFNDKANFDRRGESREIRDATVITEGKAYTPRMFPGRQRYNEVQVWDDHGQMLYEDAMPGVTMMDGIAMDAQDNLYVLATPNRVLDGEPYFLERAETLIKARPLGAKLASGKQGLPLPLEPRPNRPPDMQRSGDGPMWIEGHQWLYGGVGYGGFNSSKGGGGCACWHARFALDHFARSFAPEVDHYSVAVLDTAGNLILRIGQYGNVDSDGPSSLVPLPGDGVGLFDAAYVATHTDHRLFIADGGNARIVSVALNYHVDQRLPLAAAE